MTDKPLHVRVAEALGCKLEARHAPHPEYPGKIQGPLLGWDCNCPNLEHVPRVPEVNVVDRIEWEPDYGEILHYDTDWSATGPLIEKYNFCVARHDCDGGPRPWGAWSPDTMAGIPDSLKGFGPTPLLAVCNLLLALKEAGKLTP